MKRIRYISRLTCASFLTRLRKSGSDTAWVMGFNLGFSVDTVMGAPIGSPLGYYINMLLGLELCNYFVTREGYLVGVSLGTIYGLMIVTGEGY